MTDLSALKMVYFLGIGGIGMSALARYFVGKGATVSGYDRTPTALTDQMISEGMKIHFKDDIKLVPKKIDLVIYTPAIPEENEQYRYFIRNKIPMKKRAEVLGMITSSFKSIAIAGTHGKTTTSTMIAHFLRSAKMNHLAFLGGISKNYGTNFLTYQSAQSKEWRQSPGGGTVHFHEPVYCVVEADEYDRSFLQLNPDIAVITSADPDHLDIYQNYEFLKNSFADFTSKIREQGSLVMKLNTPVKPVRNHFFYDYSYALNQEATFFAKNIRLKDGLIHFDFSTPTEIISNMILGVPGMFNLENAIAALAVGYLLGISKTLLTKSLRSYLGVRRRFDLQICRKDFIYIDDYAHHPEEIKACLNAVRELFPGKKMTVIFQPHLFSRTKDLVDEFARSLELADNLLLLDIYPAREKPIAGVSSQLLLKKINKKTKKIIKKKDIISELTDHKPEVLVTLGAGDIDQLVDPIFKTFTTQR